jgi:two-component system response regulator FlrC
MPALTEQLRRHGAADVAVILGHERPLAPALESRPAGRAVVLAAARRCGQARLEGGVLHLALAAHDLVWGAALIAAHSAPGRPAAADPASAALLALTRKVGASPASVLIEGATGTGKEGLARLVHEASSRRAAPFVAVNCAALPEQMVEATLFGHERGAFTGAAAASPGLVRSAAGGTLFLDEVAELPLPAQAKLLRVLQEREILAVGATRPVAVDVRIVAAGNRDLAAEVAAGRFRADLYWRLAVFPLKTLPLADRPDDIIAIAAHWLLGRAGGDGLVPWLAPCARGALLAHSWPGNVRELGNVLDRALVLCDGPDIRAEHLLIDPPLAGVRPAAADTVPPALPGLMRAHERDAIHRALASSASRRDAARQLGISERTLRYKLASLRADGAAATIAAPAHAVTHAASATVQ